MRVRWLAVLICLFGAMALGMTACGDDDEEGGGGGVVKGNQLTIYSSLPRQGSGRTQTLAIENGAKLALRRVGGRIGRYRIKYVPLDDSTAQAGKWDASAVSANARKAAQDPRTIAYIGEFNSGASAISIPILNEAGIPQVSPANTAVDLTTSEGAEKGAPDKYYPTGKRTYARTPPRDKIQGAALVTIMREDGCRNFYMLNDKEVYGAGLAKNISESAKEVGLRELGNDGIDPKAPNYRSLAAKIRDAGAQCFVFSGITQNNGVQVYKDVAAAVPGAKLYGPDGVAESAFVDPKKGGIPANIARRVTLTVATLSPEEYARRRIPARRFFDDYEKTYGTSSPDPYAIFGYETMSLVLDAIKRAGPKGNDRNAVLKDIFATRDRKSVLGTYGIDKNGDTTLTTYGVWKVRNGALTFQRAVEAKGV